MKLPPYHPFDPLIPLRITIALKNDLNAIKKIFNYIWRDGNDINDHHKLSNLTKNLGIQSYKEIIQDKGIKNTLKVNTKNAVAKGVFGVPTFLVENQIFWGMDSKNFLMDYLKNAKLIENSIFRKVDLLKESNYQRKKFRK